MRNQRNWYFICSIVAVLILGFIIEGVIIK